MTQYRAALPTPGRRQPCAVLPGAIIRSRKFLTDVADHLTALEQLPTLIVWADADIAFGDKERKRWEATFPNHTTVVLNGIGHFLQSDAPEALTKAILAWSAKLDGDPFVSESETAS